MRVAFATLAIERWTMTFSGFLGLGAGLCLCSFSYSSSLPSSSIFLRMFLSFLWDLLKRFLRGFMLF